MRFTDARARSRLCSAIALLAAVWMLTITADSALPWVEATAPHHPHGIVTSHGGNSAVADDHSHVGAGEIPAPPQTLAAALPPRAATALAALGLVAALVAAAALFAQLVLPAIRGPPRAVAAVPTGQQVVTLFCIARR